MIHLIAIVTAKPGKRADVLALVRANVPLVQAEQGCIEYSPLIDADESQNKFGGDTFVVVEKWLNEAALAGHRTTAHMAEYAAKSKAFVQNRSIYLLRSVPME